MALKKVCTEKSGGSANPFKLNTGKPTHYKNKLETSIVCVVFILNGGWQIALGIQYEPLKWLK